MKVIKNLIAIEGNIGVGKSTLAGNLKEHLNCVVMDEPVKENPYLELFYQDPKRYGLEMQFFLAGSRLKMHFEAIQEASRGIVILDRSIYGDSVFCKLNNRFGNISNLGRETYFNFWNAIYPMIGIPEKIIYLDAKTETCMDRIKLRGREYEKAIDVNYIIGLSELYKEMIRDMGKLGSQVYVIDWENFKNPIEICEVINGQR